MEIIGFVLTLYKMKVDASKECLEIDWSDQVTARKLRDNFKRPFDFGNQLLSYYNNRS